MCDFETLRSYGIINQTSKQIDKNSFSFRMAFPKISYEVTTTARNLEKINITMSMNSSNLLKLAWL